VCLCMRFRECVRVCIQVCTIILTALSLGACIFLPVLDSMTFYSTLTFIPHYLSLVCVCVCVCVCVHVCMQLRKG